MCGCSDQVYFALCLEVVRRHVDRATLTLGHQHTWWKNNENMQTPQVFRKAFECVASVLHYTINMQRCASAKILSNIQRYIQYQAVVTLLRYFPRQHLVI